MSHMSPFYQRNLRRDFNKSLFRELEEAEFDAMLVDLVEERYDLYTKDDEVISDSHALEITSLKRFCETTMTHAARGSFPEDAFDKAFAAFSTELARVAAGRPVFLNVCNFAHQYVYHGSLQVYDPTYVNDHNSRLDRYYRCMCSAQEIVSIDSRAQGFRGSVEHTWGIYPFHYEDAFYQFIIDSIRAHLGSAGVANTLSHEEFRFSPSSEEYQRDALTVRDLFIAQDFEGCIAFVDGLRRSRRLSADECHYYGRALLHTPSQVVEAIQYLETALRHRASEPIWVHISLAQAFRMRGDSPRALRELLTATSLTDADNTYVNGLIYDELTELMYKPDLTLANRTALSEQLRAFWRRAR